MCPNKLFTITKNSLVKIPYTSPVGIFKDTIHIKVLTLQIYLTGL